MWKNRIIGYEEVDPEQLLANPRNWRIHPQSQQEALEGVLDEVGWVDDIIVNQRTGFVLDGHLRVALAISQNQKTVPVKYIDVSEDEEMLLLATFDPITAMAVADKENLAELMTGIESDNERIQQLLDDIAKREGIELETKEAPEAQIDRADELQKKWKVKRGQIWEIGRHRLMCGDSTSEEDVEELLNGAEPYLMITDPPYGIEYDPNWRNIAATEGKLSYAARRVGQVIHDNRSDWSEVYSVYPCSVLYTWSTPSSPIIITGQSIQNAGFEIRALIVWSKPHSPISRGHYKFSKYEPCWYAVRKGKTAKWIGPINESTVWEIALDKNVEGGLSVQKPVECMARPMRNHKGEVCDPFIGTGSTIVAAEQLNRICYGMEIEPKYCAVTLERMSDMGLKPKLIDT